MMYWLIALGLFHRQCIGEQLGNVDQDVNELSTTAVVSSELQRTVPGTLTIHSSNEKQNFVNRKHQSKRDTNPEVSNTPSVSQQLGSSSTTTTKNPVTTMPIDPCSIHFVKPHIVAKTSQDIVDHICHLKYKYDDHCMDEKHHNANEILLIIHFAAQNDKSDPETSVEDWTQYSEFLPQTLIEKKNYHRQSFLKPPTPYHITALLPSDTARGNDDDVTAGTTLYRVLGLSQWDQIDTMMFHVDLTALADQHCHHTIVQLPRDRDMKLRAMLTGPAVLDVKSNINAEALSVASFCPAPRRDCYVIERRWKEETIQRFLRDAAASGLRSLRVGGKGYCKEVSKDPPVRHICLEQAAQEQEAVYFNSGTPRVPRWVLSEPHIMITDWSALTSGLDKRYLAPFSNGLTWDVFLHNTLSADDVVRTCTNLFDLSNEVLRNSVVVAAPRWVIDTTLETGGLQMADNSSYVLKLGHDKNSMVYGTHMLSQNMDSLNEMCHLIEQALMYPTMRDGQDKTLGNVLHPLTQHPTLSVQDNVLTMSPWNVMSDVLGSSDKCLANGMECDNDAASEAFVLFYDRQDLHSFRAQRTWEEVSHKFRSQPSILIIQSDVYDDNFTRTLDLRDDSLLKPDKVPSIYHVIRDPSTSHLTWYYYGGDYYDDTAISEWIYMHSINDIVRFTIRS